MKQFCPIRYENANHTKNAECVNSCAWYVNGDCAMVSLHDVANEVADGLHTLDKTLFDTLGSVKTGDALDAIAQMPEIMIDMGR